MLYIYERFLRLKYSPFEWHCQFSTFDFSKGLCMPWPLFDNLVKRWIAFFQWLASHKCLKRAVISNQQCHFTLECQNLSNNVYCRVVSRIYILDVWNGYSSWTPNYCITSRTSIISKHGEEVDEPRCEKRSACPTAWQRGACCRHPGKG
jgi:hypothetical protein